MEHVNTDRYLDPPDTPTHGECDGPCHGWFDNGDLTKVGKYGPWLCDECLEISEQEGDDGNES